MKRISARLLLGLVLSASILIPGGQVSARQSTGAVILHDDFSDNASGWAQEETEQWKTGYDSEEYFVVNLPVSERSAGVFAFGILPADLADYHVEVDVRLPNGGEDERAALGVRLSEVGFVGLTVNPARGRCSLIRFIPREDSGLRGVPMVPEAECLGINPGSATNRLGLVVEGGNYAGYINGQEVMKASAEVLPAGGFALVVAGPASATTEGRFDNFTLWELGAR